MLAQAQMPILVQKMQVPEIFKVHNPLVIDIVRFISHLKKTIANLATPCHWSTRRQEVHLHLIPKGLASTAKLGTLRMQEKYVH